MRHKHSVNSFVFSPFTTKGPKFYSSFKCFESIQSKMYKETVQKIQVLQKLNSLENGGKIQSLLLGFDYICQGERFGSRCKKIFCKKRFFEKFIFHVFIFLYNDHH